jgi:flagellar basal body-associated protein FliL
MSEETPVAAVDSPHEAMPSEDPVGSQPIAGKSKRFWLLLLAALAVVAVAVAVLVLVRGSDTRTPQYSLEQMANAARNKDWDGVQKYIDVDAVTSTFVDAAISNAFGADTSGTVGADSAMKPKAIQQIKDSLKRRVEDTSGVGTGDLSEVLYVD